MKQLLSQPVATLDRLPGLVRSMHDAVAAGNLVEADRRADRAVGTLLTGPGHSRRRTAGWLRWVAWSWLVVMVSIAMWVVW